jgi:hypothetical protein
MDATRAPSAGLGPGACRVGTLRRSARGRPRVVVVPGNGLGQARRTTGSSLGPRVSGSMSRRPFDAIESRGSSVDALPGSSGGTGGIFP